MTQFLIEEAAFLAFDIARTRPSEEQQAEQELLKRHAEMTALRERMRQEA